jgi:hypothetical protein
MSDMLCRKSMHACPTPGMCSPHGGCRAPEQVQIDQLKAEVARLTEDASMRAIRSLRGDCEVLRAENESLRANRDRALSMLQISLEEWTKLRADTERLDWLDKQCVGYGYEDVHEGNSWDIGGPFGTVREAIDVMSKDPQS